jgi:outer membrane lipoprotein SlyB
MKPVSTIALVGILSLSACVVAPPTGPSVAVMPGPGKSFDQFQQDDASCRQYASQQTGNVSPSEAATNSAVGSAALGTVIGAAAGAALGAAAGNPGLGAAAGAGGGLLFGSAAGSNAAATSGANLQQRYDVGYLQCMTARGDSMPPAPAPAAYYGPYPYPYPAYPGYYYPPAGSVYIGGRFHGRW